MIGVSFARCAGWLHKADGGRGVILCSAHGLEELCARKSWKMLADRLAAAGMPTLRFDYHGTADSDGSSEDPGRVEAWRSSVREAIHWLEDNLGVSEVVLIGLRAGALLATLEAEKHGNILGLGLLAPVKSGREYVGDLKRLAQVLSPPVARVSQPRELRAGVEVAGFHERPETIADIEGLSFAGLDYAPARKVLLLSQRGADGAELQHQLTVLGASVTSAEFPGYELMMCDPIASRVPKTAIDRIVDWAASLAPMPQRRMRSLHRQDLDGDSWIETGVCFGPGRALTGVLCQPQYKQATEPPVIFLNTGMVYHIGWGRMTVDQARVLAAAGVPSLRIDSAGIGDSGAIPGLDGRALYGDAADASLVCAVDWLEAHGFETPTVVGGSSGAYTAFRGLRTDARLKRALLVNLPCFHWSPSMGCEPEYGSFLRHGGLSRSVMCANESDLLASLATRTRDAASVVTRFAGRVVRAVSRSGRMAGDGATRQDIRSCFREFSARGCELMMVYSARDAGLRELLHWTGPLGGTLLRLPGISVRIIENVDHNLTSPEDRASLLRHLTQFTGARTANGRNLPSARHDFEPYYEMAGSGI